MSWRKKTLEILKIRADLLEPKTIVGESVGHTAKGGELKDLRQCRGLEQREIARFKLARERLSG